MKLPTNLFDCCHKAALLSQVLGLSSCTRPGGGGGVLYQCLGIGVPLRVSNPDHV